MLSDVSDLDDAALLAAFDAQRIDARGWTHEAHLRTAFVMGAQHDLDEAHLRVRAGIIRLNQAHGLVETGQRGYFETLTRAWLHLVDDARRRSDARDSRVCIARAPELLDRALVLRHYSRDLLFSVRARSVFMPPDLLPLPER